MDSLNIAFISQSHRYPCIEQGEKTRKSEVESRTLEEVCVLHVFKDLPGVTARTGGWGVWGGWMSHVLQKK